MSDDDVVVVAAAVVSVEAGCIQMLHYVHYRADRLGYFYIPLLLLRKPEESFVPPNLESAVPRTRS